MQDLLSRYKQVELLKKRTEREIAGEELRKIKHLEDRQHQTQDLQKRVLWAEVQEIENEIAVVQRDIEGMDESIQEFTNRIEKEQDVIKSLQAKAEDANEKIESLANDLSLQQMKNQTLGKEYDAALEPVCKAKEELQDCQRNLNKFTRQIRENQQSLKTIAKKMEEKANDTRKKKQLEKLNENMSNLRQQKEEYQNQLIEIEQKQQEIGKEIENLSSAAITTTTEKNRVDREIREINNEIQDAKRAAEDRRFRFGQNMVKLMDDLARYKSESPIFCPIGDYVTLKDSYKPWSNAIECQLDNTLCGAVCDMRSHKDLQFLNDLGRKHHIFNFNVIAISYTGDFNVPTLPYRTIIDAFEYSHPLVRKALISSNAIESTILAHDVDEVLSITGSGSERSLPENCRMIVTENGDTHRVKNGKPNMSANRKQARGYLAKNSETMTQKYEATLRQKNIQMKGLLDRISQFEQQRAVVSKEKVKLDRSYNSISQTIYELDRKMQHTQQQLDVIAGEDDEGELANLRSERDELAHSISELEEKQKQEEERLHSLKEDLRTGEAIANEAKQKVAEMKRIVEETTMRLAQLRDSKNLDSQINRSELVIKKAQEEIKKIEAAKAEKEAYCKEKQAIVDASVAKLGPENRIQERLNRHACEMEYQRMNQELEQEIRRLGISSIEEVESQWQKANEAYQKSEREYKSIKREGQQMDDLNKRQRLSYSELRNEAQQQICKRFTMFLSQRKAEGKVSINHNTKEVSLAVKMDSTNEVASSQVSNIRVLSGGEKSFVTLSLIMATAHIIESPFFVMDEFDVFMDEANRVVSLHTIIDTARQEKRQFIFITPHNLETVVKEMGKEGKKDIHIFRLNDHQSGRNT